MLRPRRTPAPETHAHRGARELRETAQSYIFRLLSPSRCLTGLALYQVEALRDRRELWKPCLRLVRGRDRLARHDLQVTPRVSLLLLQGPVYWDRGADDACRRGRPCRRRFNQAPLAGFEAHVGRRTTIESLNTRFARRLVAATRPPAETALNATQLSGPGGEQEGEADAPLEEKIEERPHWLWRRPPVRPIVDPLSKHCPECQQRELLNALRQSMMRQHRKISVAIGIYGGSRLSASNAWRYLLRFTSSPGRRPLHVSECLIGVARALTAIGTGRDVLFFGVLGAAA